MKRMMSAANALLRIQEQVAKSGGDGSHLLNAVVDHVNEAFEASAGAVIELLDGDRLRYVAASGPAAAHRDVSVPVEGSLSGACLRADEPSRCDDTEQDPRVDREACRRLAIRSMLIVPLKVGDRLRGVLKVYSAEAHAFDDRDILSARLLASPIVYGLSAMDAVEASRRFEATFEQAAVGIAHVSPAGEFLRVNARFCAITGRTAQDLVAGGFQRITHPEDLEADLRHVADLLAGHVGSYSLEKRYLKPDGDVKWVNLTVSLVREGTGAPNFLVAVIEDIDARKQVEQLASFDPLTGLPNRRRIEALIDELLVGPDTHEPMLAFLDLDNFKSVNDSRGHEEGDQCLVAIAEGLKAQLRRGDVIGRMGGDEFVLLLPHCPQADADHLLDRLENAVAVISARHGWRVGISAGLIPIPTDGSRTRQDLLKSSDRLMYASKRQRKSARRWVNEAVSPGGERRRATDATVAIGPIEPFGSTIEFSCCGKTYR